MKGRAFGGLEFAANPGEARCQTDARGSRQAQLNGDASSLDRFLELAKIFNNGAAVESVGDEALAAEDQAILDAYAEEVRSRPPSGAITVRPGVAEDSGANLDG